MTITTTLAAELGERAYAALFVQNETPEHTRAARIAGLAVEAQNRAAAASVCSTCGWVAAATGHHCTMKGRALVRYFGPENAAGRANYWTDSVEFWERARTTWERFLLDDILNGHSSAQAIRSIERARWHRITAAKQAAFNAASVFGYFRV